MATVMLNTRKLTDYRKFLEIKRLPSYRIIGHEAWFPDEYANRIGSIGKEVASDVRYVPSPFCFDYQRDIASIILRKKKFAIFADCGLGKTIMYFECAKALLTRYPNRGVLILSPLMVCEQTVAECQRFYGDSLPIEHVDGRNLNSWLASCGGKLGITNYEALQHRVERGELGCLIPDESSILKSHYGKYGQEVIRLGKGVEYKICGTGTPAPNDRIEYANHAVFLDQFPTVNSFLAKFFINRGQTNERWELKPHALEPFYRTLSHWSIFLQNPKTYGWTDNCESLPPIHVHVDEVDMTESQHASVRRATGGLFATSVGGITSRSTFSKIAKGLDGSATLKYEYIKRLIDSWPDESTIIWCWYNEEQAHLERVFPEAASIEGSTPHAKRLVLIDDFKAGRRKVLISKPKVLGFGLNLQIATRQVFSSLIDSYEQYYQAVKRSNRYGSTKPLNVHIPVLDVERPMVDNVLRKAANVQRDTEEQERIFRKYGLLGAVA